MDDAVAMLRSLTRTAIDSAEGYALAGEHARSHHLKNVLNEAAARRLRMVAELNELLVRLGQEPERRGSGLGSLHHIWVRVTEAFRDNDEAAAERVEEGEDYIEGKFREALASGAFAPEILAVIERIHSAIVEDQRMSDRLVDQYD